MVERLLAKQQTRVRFPSLAYGRKANGQQADLKSVAEKSVGGSSPSSSAFVFISSKGKKMDSVDNMIYDHIMAENEKLKLELSQLKEKIQMFEAEDEGFEIDQEIMEIIEGYAASKVNANVYGCQPCFIENVEVLEKHLAKVTLTVYLEVE